MAARKRTKKTAAAKHAGPSDAAIARAKAAGVPTYTKDHEIAAARAAHGVDYDRLIAKGSIVAPTTEELPQAELDARLAKADARREAKEDKE